MKLKSVLLGSAAAIVATSGVRAADAVIIPEPEAVEYVRVCDVAGTGYFYIPGTETCLKVGGYVRFQMDAADLDLTVDPTAAAAVVEAFSFNSVLPATVTAVGPAGPGNNLNVFGLSGNAINTTPGFAGAGARYLVLYDAFDTTSNNPDGTPSPFGVGNNVADDDNFTVENGGPGAGYTTGESDAGLAALQANTAASNAWFSVGNGQSALTPGGNNAIPAQEGAVFGLVGEEYNKNTMSGLHEEFAGLVVDAYVNQLIAAAKTATTGTPSFLLPIGPTAIDLLAPDVIANLKANLGNSGYQQAIWTLDQLSGGFGVWTSAQSAAAWQAAYTSAIGTAATLLGFEGAVSNDGWSTTSSGRLVVESFTAGNPDVKTRMQFGATAGGDLGLEEATISLVMGASELMMGLDDTLYDAGINGEFDSGGGADINQIRYSFMVGDASFAVSLENEDNNVDYMPNVVANASFATGGALAFSGYVYYDDYDAGGSNDALAKGIVMGTGPLATWANGQDGDEWGAKLIVSADLGVAVVEALGTYNSGKSFYDNGYEWSVGASAAFDVSEAATVTVGGQYFDGFLVGGKTWGDVTGFDDHAYKIGATLDYEITSGLDMKADLQYQHYDYGLATTKGWAGFLRFEGSF